MGQWAPKYTDEQREAVAVAYLDRGVKPASRICDLAAAGQLATAGDANRTLEPFEIPVASVRDIYRNARRRRSGALKSGLTDVPHRDAIESLRQRLVSVADHELARVEKQQARANGKPVDPELLRQIARAVREIAALPGPNDARPVKPGDKIPGENRTAGGPTVGGIAGQILSSHRRTPSSPDHEPRPDLPPSTDEQGTTDNDRALAAAAQPQSSEQTGTDAAPGAWMRERVGAIPSA